MNAYKASLRANAASLNRTVSKARSLAQNNALTHAMKKKTGGK